MYWPRCCSVPLISHVTFLRNYIKGVYINNAVVNAKNCTLFVFPLEKYKFVIPTWFNLGIVLNHGNLWFSCVKSSESAVCHVTGINNEYRLWVLEIQKVQGYTIIFPILCKYLLKLDKFLYPKSATSKFFLKYE